jgi:hypothetical protein
MPVRPACRAATTPRESIPREKSSPTITVPASALSASARLTAPVPQHRSRACWTGAQVARSARVRRMGPVGSPECHATKRS